jgi:signal transduction histidine kinase
LLVLRLLLHASGIPGDHSPWFSIPAWGGLLSSPGELFLTALFLLFGLLVLLRPSLLADSEEGETRPPSSNYFLPAILLPFLASLLAHFLSRGLFQAAAPQWLFLDPLPGGPAFLLDLSLFLLLLTILGLFLFFSRMAWNRVPDLRRLRIPALFAALLLPLAGPSWTLFPATLLMLLASQRTQEGQMRRSGKLFPLLLLALTAGLLAFGGREIVQLQYLPFLEKGGALPWGELPPLSRISTLADGSPSFSARLMGLLAQFSFSLTALVLLLLLDLGLTRLPFLRTTLPPLFMPRGPGFRHRLLAGFLLVALLPTALIAFLGAEQVLRQMDRASQRSSLERAHSALRILEEEVRQEATLLAAGEYVRDFLLPATLSDEAHAKIPEMHELMIFDGGGQLKLDETFRGWTSAQADSFLRSTPRSKMSFELLRDRQDRPRLFAAYLLPWTVLDHDGRKVPCTVYYRKQLQSDLLARIVREIEGELALYLDGQRVQASPGALRLCSDYLAAEQYREIFISGRKELLGTGVSGEERYGQSWIALHDPGARALAVLSSLDYPGVSERSAVFQQGLSRVFALSSLLVLLALGLGSFLAERVYGPIRSLQIGTRRIAEGDFSEKLPASGNDEIGELVDSFNLMSGQLEEAQEELVRKKQLEAWSEMARQVAHEIKNPLTPIQLSVQHAERAWKDKSDRFPSVFEDTVRTVRSQVEILGRIAREFSSFGRSRALEIQKVDLASMAEEILLPYQGELEVQLHSSGPLWVMADAEALRKVLLNLIENAREAMEGGGLLEVSWQQEEERAVWLLRDFGTGISEEARERLFEPYFSTKTSGTGLGLAICAQLLEEMKGGLELINQEGGGVLTRLHLPPAED